MPSGMKLSTLGLILVCLFFLTRALAQAASVSAQPAPGPIILADFSKTRFEAAYEQWKDRITYENSAAALRGIDPRGGALLNGSWDLSGRDNQVPLLLAKRSSANQRSQIKLILRDADGTTAFWTFDISQLPTDRFTAITPTERASLAIPNTAGDPGAKPGLDLAHITMWHLQGNYAPDGKTYDLSIRQISIAPRPQPPRKPLAQITPTPRTAKSPTIEHVAPVAPDVLAVEIQAGKVIPAHIEPYKPLAGDEKKPADNGKQLQLFRNGQHIGWLIGERRDTLAYREQFDGDALQTDLADHPDNYRIRGTDDPAYAQPQRPLDVYRKSKPDDWVQPPSTFAMRHIVYFVLPKPLTAGKTYTIDLGKLNVSKPVLTYLHDPTKVRSEAVHVNQIGFRPDDPLKRAFLSVWLGNGGGRRYPPDLSFSVLNDATGALVLQGKVQLAVDMSQPEHMARTANFNKTSVYRMDFAQLTTPGTYRIYVEGIGCSYPFPIAPDVWEKAFLVQMKGFYNNRSGMELGPPYTDFHRPRDFHPADGAKVYQSTYSALDGGNVGEGLEKHSTGKLVPDAWGGYQDAGDWNPRHTPHLWATWLQLELIQMRPDYFLKLNLNIPHTWDVPDLLDECLWHLDLFRRLQTADGGIPRGIETNGDPLEAEVSWIQSMPAYVFAPDMQSSYQYAAPAARLAGILQQLGKADLAQQYSRSAMAAMTFADQQFAAAVKSGKDPNRQIRMDRCVAALALYALTSDKHWHDVFLQDNGLSDANVAWYGLAEHDHRDVAFDYARLDDKLADPKLKARARQIILDCAAASLKYAAGNAFNLTQSDPGRPMFIGFYSVPGANELVRAHYLTGDKRYLAGTVQACLFASGCNPNNMTYTTGVGANPPLHTLKVDSRRTGQPTPVGMTPYGNMDFIQWKEEWATWPIKYHLDKACTPSAWDWPISEAYYDMYLYPAICEPTMNQTYGPNAYIWGYLASRP